jgi:hypothetical protein
MQGVPALSVHKPLSEAFMALEELLSKLTVSIDANTAALKAMKAGGGGGTVAATAEVAEKEKAKPEKPKGPTFETIKVAANKLVEKHGKPFAKKLISDVGGAKELAAVKPEKYPALFKALEAAMIEGATDEEEGAEDDEL